jgi:N-acetylglucosamine-6-phosphate deacetylase
VPRPTKRVKTFGAIDLHFHGAFGIDLMTAKAAELDTLSAELWKRGVAGFSATTLSASEKDLAATVARLGAWIRSGSAPGAKPLGIHLEGPFLNPDSAGAHPHGILRKLTIEELEKLWTASKQTLQILTVAPETLSDALLPELAAWAKKRRIRLSVGHTRCTKAQAAQAFAAGFSGVTHAWNALSYHHREPGVLGAAFDAGRLADVPKNTKIRVEIIPDEVHVDSTIIDWTLALHSEGTFFVSDAAPAAGTDGSRFHRFGDLECRFQNGASRLPNGGLAGGGYLLTEAFCMWIERESRRKKIPAAKLLKLHLRRIHELPLEAVFLPKSFLRKFPVAFEIYTRGAEKGRISVLPISKRR